MNVLIFGGTTESRILSGILRDCGATVTVCVATNYGREEQAQEEGIRILAGKLPKEKKVHLFAQMDLCIDATHPYAEHITSSVREACISSGTPYYRLLRERSQPEDAVLVPDAAAAAKYLSEKEGNILLTTGGKELSAFSILLPRRLYVRILPTCEALAECEKMRIPHRNIIAMQGPFTQELNQALLHQFSICYLVTKDGGTAGGFPEKAAAAKACGAEVILLQRPAERGLSMDEILSLCDRFQREAKLPNN